MITTRTTTKAVLPIDLRAGGVLLAYLLAMIGGMLLAVQMRLQVPIGLELGADYNAQPLMLYLVIAAAVLLVHFATLVMGDLPVLRSLLAANHPYRRYLVTVGAAAVLVLLLLPEISQLQLIYFAVNSTIIGFLGIALPIRVYLRHPKTDLIRDMRLAWESRFLLRIWLNYNIQARYAQRVLGVLWIVLLPVATALVLTIAFTQFMRIQVDVPYISFYLAALVPYNIFSAGITGSPLTILSRVGIITKVYFPREILVLLSFGELMVDFCFMFLTLLVINLISGIFPNVYFIYLPFLLLILIGTTLGLMFIISALSVVIRDIPQLVAVMMQLFFFLTPVIYPIDRFPEQFRFLFVINPIAAVIQGFRDVIVYARPPDPVSLYYPVVFAGIALVLGYTTFKSFESEMADML